MKTFFIVSLACAAMLHNPVLAQVYKWVDDKGNVHFSDRPQTLDTEQVQVKTVAPSGSNAAAPAAQSAGGTVNCMAAAENTKRILQNQTENELLRIVAADPQFSTEFAAECERNIGTAEGKAEAICLQNARDMKQFASCDS